MSTPQACNPKWTHSLHVLGLNIASRHQAWWKASSLLCTTNVHCTALNLLFVFIAFIASITLTSYSLGLSFVVPNSDVHYVLCNCHKPRGQSHRCDIDMLVYKVVLSECVDCHTVKQRGRCTNVTSAHILKNNTMICWWHKPAQRRERTAASPTGGIGLAMNPNIV